MLYVYGIVAMPESCNGIPRGHGGAPVSHLAGGDLAAVVSAWEQTAIHASVENVWRHERVLRAIMERHAVLPMRFGTIVSAPDRILSILARRRRQLVEDLRRVGGKVEIALRVSYDASGTRSVEPERRRNGAPGTAYLQAKMDRLHRTAAMRRRVCAASQSIRDRLDRLPVDSVWDFEAGTPVPADGPGVSPVKASYLVTRDGLADFVDTVAEIAEQHSDLRITCTGPWAPYSFVGGSAAAAGAQ